MFNTNKHNQNPNKELVIMKAATKLGKSLDMTKDYVVDIIVNKIDTILVEFNKNYDSLERLINVIDSEEFEDVMLYLNHRNRMSSSHCDDTVDKINECIKTLKINHYILQ